MVVTEFDDANLRDRARLHAEFGGADAARVVLHEASQMRQHIHSIRMDAALVFGRIIIYVDCDERFVWRLEDRLRQHFPLEWEVYVWTERKAVR